MFDADWLARRGEDELLDLYDWSRTKEKQLRRHMEFGLSAWYAAMAVQVIEQLGRYYNAELGGVITAYEQLRLSEAPANLDQDPAT